MGCWTRFASKIDNQQRRGSGAIVFLILVFFRLCGHGCWCVKHTESCKHILAPRKKWEDPTQHAQGSLK